MDQDFKFKAAMEDEISPRAGDIRKNLRTTQEAFSSFQQAATSASKEAGRAVSDFATSSNKDLSDARSGLDSFSKSYRNLSRTMQRDGVAIGKTLEDSLYTSGAERRIKDLEKELSGLDAQINKIAARNRPTQRRSRAVKDQSRDLISRKLVPALDQLHDSLSEYPSTLKKLTAAEKERIDQLNTALVSLAQSGGGGGGAVDRTWQKGKYQYARTKGFFEEAGVGMGQAANTLMTGAMGATGIKFDSQLTGFIRTGKRSQEDLDRLYKSFVNISNATQATQGELTEFYDMVAELDLAPEKFERLTADLYKITKATGLAAQTTGDLYLQMDRFLDMSPMNMAKGFDHLKRAADKSLASITEIASVMQTATREAVLFTKESDRARYIQSSQTAAAGFANAGMGAGWGQGFESKLLDDVDFFHKVQAYTGMDVGEALRSGDQVRVAEIGKAYADKIPVATEQLRNPIFRAQAREHGLEPEEIARLREGKFGHGGEKVSMQDLAQTMQKGAEGSIFDAYKGVRARTGEQMNALAATGERAAAIPGQFVVKNINQGLSMLNRINSNMYDKLTAIDEKMGGFLGKAVGHTTSLGTAMTMMRSVFGARDRFRARGFGDEFMPGGGESTSAFGEMTSRMGTSLKTKALGAAGLSTGLTETFMDIDTRKRETGYGAGRALWDFAKVSGTSWIGDKILGTKNAPKFGSEEFNKRTLGLQGLATQGFQKKASLWGTAKAGIGSAIATKMAGKTRADMTTPITGMWEQDLYAAQDEARREARKKAWSGARKIAFSTATNTGIGPGAMLGAGKAALSIAGKVKEKVTSFDIPGKLQAADRMGDSVKHWAGMWNPATAPLRMSKFVTDKMTGSEKISSFTDSMKERFAKWRGKEYEKPKDLSTTTGKQLKDQIESSDIKAANKTFIGKINAVLAIRPKDINVDKLKKSLVTKINDALANVPKAIKVEKLKQFDPDAKPDPLHPDSFAEQLKDMTPMRNTSLNEISMALDIDESRTKNIRTKEDITFGAKKRKLFVPEMLKSEDGTILPTYDAKKERIDATTIKQVMTKRAKINDITESIPKLHRESDDVTDPATKVVQQISTGNKEQTVVLNRILSAINAGNKIMVDNEDGTQTQFLSTSPQAISAAESARFAAGVTGG